MNCEAVKDLLAAYALDDLEPGQSDAVRQHLAGCEACRREMEEQQAALGLLNAALADTRGIPERLPDRARGRLGKAAARRRRATAPEYRRWRIGMRILRYTAMAAAFLVLAGGLMLPNLGGVREKARRVNDLANLHAIWKSASAWGLDPSDSFRPTFPPSLDVLVQNGAIDSRMLVNPETGKPIEYYPRSGGSGGDRPVLVSRGKKGRNVLRAAGQGQWVGDGTPEAIELDRQLAEIKAGPSDEPSSQAGKVVGRTFAVGAVSGGVDSKPDAQAPGQPREAAKGEAGHQFAFGEKVVDAVRKDADAARASADKPQADRAAVRRRVKAAPPAAAPFPPSAPMSSLQSAAEPREEKAVVSATEMSKAIEAAGEVRAESAAKELGKQESSRLERLKGVRAFQREWGVSAERSARDQAGAPSLAEPAPPGKPAGTTKAPASGPGLRAAGVNPFVAAAVQPFSTFSVDVDTASYTLSRAHLADGRLPPAESVRTEEFVNYFDYDYAPPQQATFAVHAECGPSAFGRGLSLLKIGIKGRRLGRDEQRPLALTLLIDTSGSMATPDRLGLVKAALARMVGGLAPADTVAVVQYDSLARLVLEPTPAADAARILAAIEALQASGSTGLEEGMRVAYEAAARGFDGGSENRVLLLSDGMANLGSAAAQDILASVERHRRQGITLSIFGFGLGAYNDALLEQLADKGDGAYAFLDSEQEAGRMLADALSASANLIARDVKIQVEFNPRRVRRYRQLGYENRQLDAEQFRDDSVDAGEIGSGQTVTALYELDLQGSPDEPVGAVRVRCRNARTGQIEEIERAVPGPLAGRPFEAMDARFRLAACAAEFAEILRGSPHAAGSRLEDVARILRPVALELNLDNRIQELLRLTQTGLEPAFSEAAEAAGP